MVLSMLVGSSIIGISAMNLSLTGERLAGNQKASLQARMIAESAAAELHSYLRLDADAQAESPWADSPLATALADSNPQPCGSESERVALWNDSDDYTRYGGEGYPEARVVFCDAKPDGEDPAYIAAILGLAGSPQSPARYPSSVPLEQQSNVAGLATTNFIGGIAENAEIQWPSSKNSRLDTGPGGTAVYFDELTGTSHAEFFAALVTSGDLEDDSYTALDKTALIDSMGKNTDKIVDGEPQEVLTAAHPDRDGVNATIDLLQDIYQICQGEGVASGSVSEDSPDTSGSDIPPGQAKDKKGGKPDKDNPGQGGGPDKDNPGQGSGSASEICTYVRIVPPGAGKKENGFGPGEKTFNGLYIDLSGKLDLRGQSRVNGAAVVANVEVIDGDWVSLPNHTLKLAGGGNAGTVWFDEFNLNAAITELKNLDPDRFADLTIETFWGGGESGSNGWSFEGWVQLSVE